MFPSEYKGDAFVALHGSWNRTKRTGYKIIRIRFKNGKPVGGYDDFLTGWMLGENQSRRLGRPVGLLVLADGSMLITDDGANKIWRVTYRAQNSDLFAEWSVPFSTSHSEPIRYHPDKSAGIKRLIRSLVIKNARTVKAAPTSSPLFYSLHAGCFVWPGIASLASAPGSNQSNNRCIIEDQSHAVIAGASVVLSSAAFTAQTKSDTSAISVLRPHRKRPLGSRLPPGALPASSTNWIPPPKTLLTCESY